MREYVVGISLMAVGIVLFFLGRPRSKRSAVSASGGSVAVGGDNSAPIANINVGSRTENSSGAHALKILGILVEIIGIAVVAWHAAHLATLR